MYNEELREFPAIFECNGREYYPATRCCISPGKEFIVYLEKIFCETQYLYKYVLKMDKDIFLFVVFESYACDGTHGGEFDFVEFGVAGFSAEEAVKFLLEKILERVFSEDIEESSKDAVREMAKNFLFSEGIRRLTE